MLGTNNMEEHSGAALSDSYKYLFSVALYLSSFSA